MSDFPVILSARSREIAYKGTPNRGIKIQSFAYFLSLDEGEGVEAAGEEGLSLKSVTYQPPPFKAKPVELIILSNLPVLQTGHSFG